MFWQETVDFVHHVRFNYLYDDFGYVVTVCTVEESNKNTGKNQLVKTVEITDVNNFCKNKMRKNSLAHALKILTDDRELRRSLWESYFVTRGRY